MKTSSGDCWIYDPKPVAGETVSWSGSCDAKGRGTGSGTLEWHGSDGTEHFEGTLSEGRPHGKGSYLFHNGNRYEGNFVHDNFEGYGTFTWQDGTVYAGEYRNGKPDGDGKKTFPNGNSYEGHWRDGWPDGGGRAKIDGRYYGGTWAQGCLRKNGHLDAWFRDNQSDCP